MHERIANMDDAKTRARVAAYFQSLRGQWRLTWVRYRERRSDRQCRYYFPCFVKPFADFLRDQGESVTDLEAHEFLKSRFNSKTIQLNGEWIDVPRSTADLDTAEFNEYLDKIALWLSDFFGIVVPDPSEYHER